MRLHGFELVRGYAVRVGPLELDLHNDYEFEMIRHDVIPQRFCLTWYRSRDAGPENPERVEISFEGVSILRIDLAALEPEAEDRGVLKYLGFLHPDDLEVMDGYLEQHEAASNYHLVFGFEDGLCIKCFADVAKCKLET